MSSEELCFLGDSPEDLEDETEMSLDRYLELESQKRSRGKVCLACFNVFYEVDSPDFLGNLYCDNHRLKADRIIFDE